MFLIYCAKFPNGKLYIGKATDLRGRQRAHKLNAKTGNSRFYSAIRKYGFENIVWSVLEMTEDESTSYELEIKHILAQKSNQKDYGYNMLAESSIAISRPVVRSDGLEYQSVNAAAHDVGCSHGNIVLAIRDDAYAKGYKWFYKSDPKPDRLGVTSNRYRKNRKVRRSDGKMYDGTASAGKSVCVTYKAIHQAIAKKGKSGGFYWKYEES